MLQKYSNQTCHKSEFGDDSWILEITETQWRILGLITYYSYTITIIWLLSCIYQKSDTSQMENCGPDLNKDDDDDSRDCSEQDKNMSENDRGQSLIYCSETSEEDSDQNDGEDKPSGLINNALICYMNAMMQALSSSPKLIKNLISVNNSSKNDKLKMFIDILKSINEPTDEDLKAVNTTTRLAEFVNAVKWNRSSQQDAFQLLSFFINAIHNEIKAVENMPPKFKLLHTFSENPIYNKIQDHLALALPLVGNFRELPGIDLTTMIDSFFQQSIIDDGPYYTSMLLYKEVPDVMIMHIQANEWSSMEGQYVKPTYHIKYDHKLHYEFNVAEDADNESCDKVMVTYQLMAVVRHFGSISGGHYITYRKCGQLWYLTDDAHVEETKFDCEIPPYIMVYERE